MIITDEILNEKDDAKFVRKLNTSLIDNRSYIEELKNRNEDVEIRSIDPFEEEEAFLLHWFRHRFVIGKGIIPKELCDDTISRIKTKMSKLEDPSSIMFKGFLEIYHDDLLAQLRQNRRIYLFSALIWGTCKLNVTFDRIGLKTTGSPGLPWHIDQNPLLYPNFKTTQGVLALSDCSKNGPVLVPGSHKHFLDYVPIVESLGEGYKENFVMTNLDDELFKKLVPKHIMIPLDQGDYVYYDSRVTHTNLENNFYDRYVAYVSMGPEILDRENRMKRWELYSSGAGANIREAYSHASLTDGNTHKALEKVREDEDLTLLGELLYGFETFSSII